MRGTSKKVKFSSAVNNILWTEFHQIQVNGTVILAGNIWNETPQSHEGSTLLEPL